MIRLLSKLLAAGLMLSFLTGADISPAFETQDLRGSTNQYTGTVGTSAIAIPTVAGNVVSEALIRMPNQAPNTRRLQVSFVSSAGPWLTLSPGEFIAWSIKGQKKQFWLIGSAASISYETIVNFEEY